MSTKSGEVIIMTAFMAHRVKDISRAQLLSGLNSLTKNSGHYKSADKSKLIKPVAIALLKSNVVKVVPWAKLNNLTMIECEKVGTI